MIQLNARFAGLAWPTVLVGLLLFGIPLVGATTDPDAFVEGDLEIIPPPPSAAARPVSPAAAAATVTAGTGVGGLQLPTDLKLPPSGGEGGLSAPGYLTAIAGNRSILLSWYVSEGPKPLSGYLIFRGLSPTAIPPKAINRDAVTETNYSDSDANSVSGPLNRSTYYYRVRAFDTEGRLSPYSDVVAATPNGPLLPPGKVEAAGYDGKVQLLWSEPISTGDGDLAGLRLLRGEASGNLAPYKDLPPDARRFEDEGLSNGKAHYYALLSVDSFGNTSGPSPEVKGVPFKPLPPPQGLSALGVGDAAVRLKWSPPGAQGTFKVKGYNVYRSTGGPIDFASPPVNKSLIPASKNRYEDGPDDSVEAPKKGTDYRYAVVAVDEEGNPSPASVQSVAGPVASLTKLETGEIHIGSEANTLQISGRKTIDASYAWVAQDPNSPGLGTGALGGFLLDQQLQVRLTGKVGRKIKVDVDYDDKAVGAQQQKISVVYTGDQQEVFKEFAFGDIQMDLNSSRTEFAGYNKSLFGAKLKLVSPDERLRITAVGAQTKGISETKRIVGGYEQARTGNVLGEDKQDLSFFPYKYYYLSRDKNLVEGADFVVPGSVDIWLDQPGVTIYSAGNREVIDNKGTGRFHFIRLVQNVDYTVDSSSGLVTFNRGIGPSDNIAVAYIVQRPDNSQVSVGYDANGAFDFSSANMDSDVNTGKTTNQKKMIQYGLGYVGQYDSHMSMQYYKLNGRDILNPQLDPDFKLVVYRSNQSVFFQLDPSSNYSDIVEFDTRLGWMRFRTPFPFRAGIASADQLRMDPGFNAVETVFSGEQTDAYNRGPSRANNFTVHIEYKYKVASYNLRFGIIRGSEVILLDGRRLARDIDYFLDYDTGSLVFSNPDLVKETSVVDATYEYLPFGGQFTSTIWGTRGEYDISKDISVGSTFLWNSADAPLEVPDVRSSPYSLQILDGDIQASVPQDLVDGLIRRLPLLPERDGLLTVKARGEMARSWYRPNTYGRNNESGVAMIDSFEAVDNIASVSMDRSTWVPSSRPIRFNGDSGMAVADRRFTRFTTVQERAHDATQRVANNENPNRSMAQIEWVGLGSQNNWDAFVYSFGQTTPEAVRSASYLELWVKVDQAVTLHLDAGLVDEDSTDNMLLDTESTTGILGAGQDVGFYTAQTPGGVYPRPDSGTYLDVNYWGNGNKLVDSEDLNRNGQLDRANNYYTFSRSLNASSEFQLIQIPLTEAGIVGTDLSVVPGNINYFANIQNLRLWIRGNGEQGGRILIESIQFKGNKWQVRADSNLTTLGGISVTADTSRFQVNAINRLNNTSVAPSFTYVPNTDFFNRETNRSDDREQSLQVEYALTRLEQSDGRPYFQARKQLASGQDVDVGVYQKMRVDLYKPHDTLPGERFLLRLGTDDLNYFEYKVPLDSLGVGAWNTVTLALDGSDGRRSIVGRPYLRQVRFISLAIHTLNDNLSSDPRLQGNKQLLWINNLRLTDAIQREGGAQRVGLTYDLMNGALVVNHDLRELESDFVKMDQQAIDPQRHERSQVVDARLNAIQGLPLSLRYEQRERFTEPIRRDDPKYSRIFVDPDEANHKTSGNLSFTRIPGLSLNTAGTMESSRQIYLPAYIRSQRELAPVNDRDFIPNTSRNDLRLNQDLGLRLPPGWWGIGGDELRLEATYEENLVIFDRESVSDLNLAFRNVERRSRVMKGRYGGAYKLGDWLTLTPSYAYTLVEAEGNIPIPTVLQGSAYYDLGPDRRSDGWIPQSRVINPSLQIQLKDAGVLRSPRVAYNVTQTRDYVRNDLRTPGSLDLSTSLNLAGLGDGLKWVPAIEVNQGFGVDSVVSNDLRIRSQQRQQDLDRWLRENKDFGDRYLGVAGQNLPSLALQEQQSPLQSTWWLRLEDPLLGENVEDPLHIENIAVSASRRSNTSFSTRFDLPISEHWKGSFSPRVSFRDERTMSAPEQVTRRYQMSLGSGLEFKEPRIPWWRTLKPSALTMDFNYSNSDSYVVFLLNEQRNSNSSSHSISATLPMRPTDRMSMTASLRWSGTGESSYLGGATEPTSGRTNWQLDPALKLVYFLNIDNTWKMPDMWPFHGRELRIRQNFRLDNDLLVSIRREHQDATFNTLRDSGSNIYELINQLGYDVLDNVKLRFTLSQKIFQNAVPDALSLTSDYYAITLKLGLEAIF